MIFLIIGNKDEEMRILLTGIQAIQVYICIYF